MTNKRNRIEGKRESAAWRPRRFLLRWMQAVGAFYLLQFLMMVIVRAPIRAFGPAGALTKASQGDPLATFLVDTWTFFGLEVGAVGAVLLVATHRAELTKGAVWTVLAIEIGRGVIADMYMIARGVHVRGYLVWVTIHCIVIATGLLALRADRTDDDVKTTGSRDAPVAQSV